jgi:hypothetical protein
VWTKWWGMRFIHFWMHFSVITKSRSPLEIGTRLHSSQLENFRLGGHTIRVQECSTNLSTCDEYSFQRLFWNVHETILKWLKCVYWLRHPFTKATICFDKCKEFGMSLNLEICMFLVHSSVILGYVVFKESTL